MLLVYIATLAPSVTFWDAGEFIAAARVLGIPHPPGTPLFIVALNAWARAFPFLPFATEEVWSWWQSGSVHRARWPEAGELHGLAGSADRRVLATASEVIAAVRRAKSQAQLSMRADVRKIMVTGPSELLARFALVDADVRAARTAPSGLVRMRDSLRVVLRTVVPD
jgi:isoleucyl-tRNA synthetase